MIPALTEPNEKHHIRFMFRFPNGQKLEFVITSRLAAKYGLTPEQLFDIVLQACRETAATVKKHDPF